jgi:hypothetical protein
MTSKQENRGTVFMGTVFMGAGPEAAHKHDVSGHLTKCLFSMSASFRWILVSIFKQPLTDHL